MIQDTYKDQQCRAIALGVLHLLWDFSKNGIGEIIITVGLYVNNL